MEDRANGGGGNASCTEPAARATSPEASLVPETCMGAHVLLLVRRNVILIANALMIRHAMGKSDLLQYSVVIHIVYAFFLEWVFLAAHVARSAACRAFSFLNSALLRLFISERSWI